MNSYFRKWKLKSITKRNDLDEDFFRNIDNEEKAYCLGLWYSDGNVYIETFKNSGNIYKNINNLYFFDLEQIINFMKQNTNNTFFIIGGNQIYNLLLPYCSTIWITKMIWPVTF